MKTTPKLLLLGRLQQAMHHTGSIRQASKEVRVPYTTARRWLEKADQPPAPKGIRKGSLTAAQRHAAFESLSHASANDASSQLYKEGIVERMLHKSTIIRAAKAHACQLGTTLKYRRGLPQKELSPNTKEKRLAFAMKSAKTNWKLVLFSDRKRFQFNYPGVKVGQGKWLKGSEKHEVQKVNHAYTVNIYCGLSPYGMTVAHEVAGTSSLKSPFVNKKGQPSKNITAEEYKNVMESTLLPGGQKLFRRGKGISSWVFQQDNDPSHKAAAAHLKAWNTKQLSSISLLGNWPPNSPDLNPIENVWAWMDKKLNALGCSTFNEYRAAVSEIAKKVPQSMIDNLYKSMPRRLELVFANEGGKTGY
jgi:hypothetical protein